MDKTKIIVCGAAGKMGVRILDLARQDANIQIAGAVEYAKHPAIGIGDPAIRGALREVISAGDVIIEFTSPAATLEHLAEAVDKKRAMVIGTTGFKPEEEKAIHSAASRIPIVFSPNMSVGINLLFKLAAEVAGIIPGYDIEIVELHHNQKKDAPSGTAVKLAQVIAGALDRDLDKVGVYGRHGVIGPRKKEEIGVLAVRAGDIVGDHTIYFAGLGERIELTHRAHSRDTLAAGALRAARWVVAQKPGLYDMQDVLGFRKK
jgi:4-hydroxy-tetrahydrodipicolinate reductase